MLATPWPRLFTDPGWVFELKWDGVRGLLHWDGDRVVLRSRSGRDATLRYPELALFTADRPIVLDGEIVAMDREGRPSFERLQRRINVSSGSLDADTVIATPVDFVAFDVLYDAGDVTNEPLGERRARLEALDLPDRFARSEIITGDPQPLWDFVTERGIEGIVGKRLESLYRPGERSPDWRKVSAYRQVRAVVGGFTAGDGARHETFGALLLGLWSESGLRWIGSVGSGFSDRALRAIRDALDEIEIERCPFADEGALPKRATWVSPSLVALVQYKEWTSVGRLRGPSFKGFTDDPPREASWENEGPAG